MTTRQISLNNMIKTHGEVIGGYPSYLTLGKLVGTFEPMVMLFKHAPDGDIEIQLYARDLKVKSYLLTSSGDLYKSSNNRIHEAKREEEKALHEYILEAYKDEYGEEWRWWCEG